MTTNHIDQLREWWETAEVGDPKDGDVIIEWAGDGHAVRTFLEAERDDLYAACTYRILARAPKPKPAWHDAVAVVASTSDFGIRRVFVKDVDGIWNDALSGRGSFEGNLLDVTPLIEAKVTDEMVERARHRADALASAFIYSASEWHMREVLAAALGIESV